MQARSDAFHQDVLAASTIPRVAAVAARVHSDAPKAIDICRYAGDATQANREPIAREAFVT
jgi:cell division control protein 6